MRDREGGRERESEREGERETEREREREIEREREPSLSFSLSLLSSFSPNKEVPSEGEGPRADSERPGGPRSSGVGPPT